MRCDLYSAGLAVALLVSPARVDAQKVVRESARDWRAARQITLSETQRWCKDPDAPGCDMRAFTNAVLLPDGSVVVSDFQGPIHRFGADGRFQGPLARKGKGPGEYGFIVDLQLLPSGRLAWFDNTQMRITTIELDGKPGPITRLMPPATMTSIDIVGEEMVVLDVPAQPTPGDTVTGVYRTVPAEGSPRIMARVRTPSVIEPGTDMRRMPPPFTPIAISSVSTNGDIAHANNGRYEVEVFPRNAAAWRVVVDIPARDVTRADRDSVTAHWMQRSRVASVNQLSAQTRDWLNGARGTYPALQAMQVLRDGTLWILPTPAAGEKSLRWDVFSRDGKRLGFARLPVGARIVDGTSDWILVSQLGEDDTPVLVRYSM